MVINFRYENVVLMIDLFLFFLNSFQTESSEMCTLQLLSLVQYILLKIALNNNFLDEIYSLKREISLKT